MCCLCVARLGARKNTPVRRFKTLPCVPAKHAHVFNMRAFCPHTRKRFEPTHVEEGREKGFSSLSRPFSLSLFLLLSLFRRSLHSFSFFSFFSLSATVTMITRPIGSLCEHTALTCLSVRVPVLWLIPCLANMFVSCKKQLSWYDSASLVPHGMKWACICAGNGCCVWLC